jgi:UDP-glucose 4-epimerase
MRVVITGATGNLGTSLIEALADEPGVTSILGIARRAPAWRPPKTLWATADIATDDLTAHLRGADAVVHLAWLFQPTRDPLRTWRVNVLGSLRLYRAVVDAGVPTLIHTSSVGAYAPGPSDRPVDESWPTHALPTAAYGREKSYLERVLDTLERDQPALRVVRLRPGFVFQRASAAEQRRLFLGPLFPNLLAHPGAVPVLPDLPGLRFQVLHASDVADAVRRVLLGDARGPFNLAADPVLDAARLAELLDARVVSLPRGLVRTAVATAWHLRAIPASPQLFDLFLSLPIMDTSRARTELGWAPRLSSVAAITTFLDGLRSSAGGPTPPLDPAAGGRLRWREVASGVGGRDRTPLDGEHRDPVAYG